MFKRRSISFYEDEVILKKLESQVNLLTLINNKVKYLHYI